MKRIIYCLVILGLTLAGCNPMEDIYDGLDSSEEPIVGSESYTLTSDDYAELELGFGSFSSIDDAKTMLPGFLADKYPFWGKGSSVLLSYNLYIGNAEGISDYSGADIYQLTNADYASTGSDAFGFYPNVDANAEIPAILDAAITSPTEGKIVLAKYSQYFNDPVVGLANIYQASFPADFANFENIDVLGAEGWTSETGYAQGSGFNGGALANEDWLISPEIDLTGMTNLKFQINQEIDFLNDAGLIDILISTDYTTGGDPMAATWTALAFDKTAYGSMTLSEDFDFAYGGATVHVAFKYSSTDSDSPRWRVESFAIKTLGVDGDANKKGTHFMYSGSEWEKIDGVYFLSSADFDSMGEESGQPGRYDNFGSSTPPDNYLPTFLSLNEPWAYAQEEDEIIMVYDYFSSSSGAQIRGNRYTVIGGEWVGHESTISTTLQFGHDGTTWVPDNTMRYTFGSSDFTAIVDALGTKYPEATSSAGNYGNFDRRSGNSAEWTNDMVLEAINVVLDIVDPSAAEEQKYVVTIDVYNGSNTTEDFAVIKTGGVWVYQ